MKIPDTFQRQPTTKAAVESPTKTCILFPWKQSKTKLFFKNSERLWHKNRLFQAPFCLQKWFKKRWSSMRKTWFWNCATLLDNLDQVVLILSYKEKLFLLWLDATWMYEQLKQYLKNIQTFKISSKTRKAFSPIDCWCQRKTSTPLIQNDDRTK